MPDTLTPVPVIVIVVLPTAAIVTFPFAVATFTLLLPFASGPIKLAAVTFPPELILPATPTPPWTTSEPVVVLVLGVAVATAKVIDPELIQEYILYPPEVVTVGLPVVLNARL